MQLESGAATEILSFLMTIPQRIISNANRTRETVMNLEQFKKTPVGKVVLPLMKPFVIWVNHILSDVLNIRIYRPFNVPKGFRAEFSKSLGITRRNPGRFAYVTKAFRCDVGEHPVSFMDYECAFAAKWLHLIKPTTILDIGSYRKFIIGLLSHFKVTSIDVRDRPAACNNETVLTCDSSCLPLSEGSVEAIVSLCAIEHFGLARYGDAFDLDGDLKGMEEFTRVLRSGGHLIVTTAITGGKPFISFNSARVYSIDLIRKMTSDLTLVEESFFSQELGTVCDLAGLTTTPNRLDIYLGCYRKP